MPCSYRDWVDYETGFGDLTGNHWLGLANLQRLVSGIFVELLIYLEDFNNNWVYAQYSDFSIRDSAGNYRIDVSGYNGTAGDSMEFHNGQEFSTRDRENSPYSANADFYPCAVNMRGAWWYATCYHSNLNGEYGTNETLGGIDWYTWRGLDYGLKTTVMKIK